MPSTSGRIAAIDTRAAPISLPTSMRPVVSIVTWTCSGTSRPGGGHRPAAADHRRLDLQQVHARLDEEQVDAADEQPAGLLLVGVAQVGEADVAEARQLGARADRAGDVAGAAVGGVAVGDLAGDAGGGDVELVGLVGDVVLGEDGGEAAEAGRLDGVDADVEERRVHPGDDVGPGEAEHLVAPLERRAAEVVGREVETLDVGAEGAVEDDHPLVHGIEVALAWPWLSRGYRRPSRRCVERSRATPSRELSARPICGRPLDGSRTAADGTVRRWCAGRCTRRPATTGRRGSSTAGGWPRTPSCPTAYGSVDEAQAVLGLARAHAVGELDRVLVAVMQDLWVLMAELATLPANRSKLEAGHDGRLRGDGRAPRAAHRRPRRAVRPADRVRRARRQRHRGVARPRPHGRAPGRAPLAGRRRRRRRSSCPTSTGCRTCCGRWPGGRRPPTARRCACETSPTTLPTGRLATYDHLTGAVASFNPTPSIERSGDVDDHRRPRGPDRRRRRRRAGRREGRGAAPARPRPGDARRLGLRRQGRPDAGRAAARRSERRRRRRRRPERRSTRPACATSPPPSPGPPPSTATSRRRWPTSPPSRRRRPARRSSRASSSPATATAR